MNSGAVLWNKAKKIIPGGNQLLSKRAEMFLPGQWPAYFSKAKGVKVWDLEGKPYIDMSLMGVGTCVLGYANPAVDKAVRQAISRGTMSTLNCPEEVELAENLIRLHPWAGKVRFTRTGGEACAVAVRIARAHSRKDKVAFCGYHGWADWYLAANLSDAKNLDGQLLPGLDPLGVPRSLQGSAVPFHYGDVSEFNAVTTKHAGEIGVVIMEICRNKPVDVPFIQAIRETCDRIGAVLIFDEITSGFRVRPGGMHMDFGIQPDIVLLGKALGNGYPIAAIVGTETVMEAAQGTFISSTYWTERIGFTAALEVIRQFEERQVTRYVDKIGKRLMKGLEKIFKDLSLKIQVMGLSAMPLISIQEQEPLVVKTAFTQEMLKRGYLASTLIYVSRAHTASIVDKYLQDAREVWGLIAEALRSNRLASILEGPVCHSGFSRLT